MGWSDPNFTGPHSTVLVLRRRTLDRSSEYCGGDEEGKGRDGEGGKIVSGTGVVPNRLKSVLSLGWPWVEDQRWTHLVEGAKFVISLPIFEGGSPKEAINIINFFSCREFSRRSMLKRCRDLQ